MENKRCENSSPYCDNSNIAIAKCGHIFCHNCSLNRDDIVGLFLCPVCGTESGRFQLDDGDSVSLGDLSDSDEEEEEEEDNFLEDFESEENQLPGSFLRSKRRRICA